MKLNLGCAFKVKEGYTNVDISPECKPDVVYDLEKTPWPWEDSSVDGILMNHVLEHLGATTEVYLNIIKELYRVSKNGALLEINVPHPRHNTFLNDPTHVRPITPEGLAMFSRKVNDHWIEKGCNDTPLAIYLGVDIEIVKVEKHLDPYWMERRQRENIPTSELDNIERIYNNVVVELCITMKVNK